MTSSGGTTIGLTEAQTLIYGGGISLTTAIILLVIQAFIHWRRQGYEENLKIRERFFEYEIERLREIEKTLIEMRQLLRGSVQEIATRVEDYDRISKKIFDFMLLSSPDLAIQAKLMNSFNGIYDAYHELFDVFEILLKENAELTSLDIRQDRRYQEKYTAITRKMILFLQLYRQEVLNEPKRQSKKTLFSRYKYSRSHQQ